MAWPLPLLAAVVAACGGGASTTTEAGAAATAVVKSTTATTDAPVTTATPSTTTTTSASTTTATSTTSTTTTAAPDTTAVATTMPDAVGYAVPVRDVDVAGWSGTHAGYPATDVFVACGAEIVSPVDGTLIEVRRVDSWDPAVDDPATRGGRSIAILGDDGVRYYLAHFDEIDDTLDVGGRVAAGRGLGTIGLTGRTSACHVHFGISPPCPGPEWAVRRGVVLPAPYLDAWRAGIRAGPAGEVAEWLVANPDACDAAIADA